MPCEETCEHRREVDEQVPFAAVHGAEVHGRRDVEKEMRRDLAVLEVLPHVRRVKPSGHVPIDVADVVAEGVFANVREI